MVRRVWASLAVADRGGREGGEWEMYVRETIGQRFFSRGGLVLEVCTKHITTPMHTRACCRLKVNPNKSQEADRVHQHPRLAKGIELKKNP